MKRGFLLGKRFFEPARIRAILLVLVKSEAYIIAKLIPGITRLKPQVIRVGSARIGNTFVKYEKYYDVQL